MDKIALRPLAKDAEGNVLTAPLLGWQHMPVAGMTCFLKLDYAETEEQLRSGQTKAVQLVLTPAQALALSEDLAKMARALLDQTPGSTAN